MKSKPTYLTVRSAKARRRSNGFTLIELMISLVLGMVVIAAALVMYDSGSAANRNALAQSRMSEDAQMALDAITQELSKAGYNPVGAVAKNDLGQGGWNLFACDSKFTTVSETLVKDLACSADGSASISIVYEADEWSGKNTAAGLPMDCIGNGVAKVVGPPDYYVMQARFFIDSNALKCVGSGDLTLTPQVLAENIESLSLQFAVADPKVVGSNSPVAYVTATEINTEPADAAIWVALDKMARWNKVIAARVCVIVMSEDAVLGGLSGATVKASYVGCDGASHDIDDGKMRRSYSTTVLIRNHGLGV